MVTTGTFDGVHFGHKVIIERLVALAEKYQGESVLITFHPHPRKVLYPETVGKGLNLINSQKEKIELLREAGLHNLIIVEFTREFAAVSSREFVLKYLVDRLGAKVIVVGFNHFFGHNKEGNFKFLESLSSEYNFVTEEIPEQEVQNETVSSTEIRKALKEGFIQRVNAYLDHYYIIIADVNSQEALVSGNYLFYIIDIDEEDKMLPASGAYAVTINSQGVSERGMAIIPSGDMQHKYIWLHIFNETIYAGNESAKISFHRRMSQPIDTITGDSVIPLVESLVVETKELIF